MGRFLRTIAGALVSAWALGLAPGGLAHGQIVRPGDVPLAPGPFAPPGAEPAPIELPPVLPEPAEPDPLSAGLRVFVKAFAIEGSTIFSPQELARVTDPWTGRAITSEELAEAREAVTRYYVERG